MEPFIDPLAGGLVGILIDTLKRVGGGVVQSVNDHNKVANALKRYFQKYAARYGTVRILGMRQDISLELVYTKVRFLDDQGIHKFTSLKVLEQSYKHSQERRLQLKNISNQDGFTVVNQNQYLMVLGGPGAGKSTFLRRVGLEALKGSEGEYEHQCVPVFLELKRFNDVKINFLKAIVDELQNFGFPSSEAITIDLLEKGKLLILLDGLDEVPKVNLSAILNVIEDFVTKYDKNRFIASCRVAAYRSRWIRFRDVELADFDNSQIKKFIHNWFSTDVDLQVNTAERCWRLLNEPSNVAAKELAHTPLLLTFLCLVYDRTQGFPSNRATLYRKALDILLEEWAAEKRISSGEIYQGLNIDLEKVLLSEIAYEGFFNDQYFFAEAEIINTIREFLADTVDQPKYLDGKEILTSIVTQQGILVERAEDIYSFSHLTIQEYLAAQYISQDYNRIQDLPNSIRDRRWREIFLLVSGLMNNSDDFLLCIEKGFIRRFLLKIRYLGASRLLGLLIWSDKFTVGSASDAKPAAKRAAAIFMLFDLYPIFDDLARFLALDYDDISKEYHYRISSSLRRICFLLNLDCSLTRTDPFALDLANAVYQAKLFNNQANLGILIGKLNAIRANLLGDHDAILINEQPICDREELFQSICNSWIKVLGLSADFVQKFANLESQEIETLEDYFYSTEILIESQYSSIRVSKKVWDELGNRILKIKTKGS